MSAERTWREDFTVPRVIGFVIALLVCAVVLPWVAAPAPQAEAITAQVAARNAAKSLRPVLTKDASADAPRLLRVDYVGPEHLREAVVNELRHQTVNLVEQDVETVTASAAVKDGRVAVTYEYAAEEPSKGDARIGGFEAVLPPLIAVLVALFFRRLLLALGCAVWLGGTISVGGNPLLGAWMGASNFVWGSVAATFNLYIIGFTLTLVGMVQVITKMGGIVGLLNRFQRFTSTKRSTRMTTALLGTAIFFDDYANTIVVGTSMRPITDARKISREKLAYLVDSMSAPIAGIAIISTWVGYEVGLFGELSQQLGLGRSGYDLFFSIIPLRFYCLFTLVFVLANAWFGRDFGPMLRAERRAAAGDVARPGSRALTMSSFSATEPKEGIAYRWWNAVAPIGVVVFVAIVGMYWSGWSSGDVSIPPLFDGDVLAGWAAALPEMTAWASWREAFSNADSAKVLFWGAISGTAVAMGLGIGQRLLTPREAIAAFLKTIPTMWLAVTILVLAWSIRAVCDDLGTSIYLVGAVRDLLAPAALPIVTFLLAAVVAFSTGTSWGTMGILLPAMVPLAFYLTRGTPEGPMILLLCFGAVLDGAIFGDHCSPISDTTVMSSIASSCDHLDHVRTQMPYAVVTMLIAGSVGYLGVGFGLPIPAALIIGALAVVMVLLIAGRRIDVSPETQNVPVSDDGP